MAPLSSLLTVALVTGATAFSANSGVTAPTTATRPSTKLYENFGFDFAEDQVENTPQLILGEANYKKWVNTVDPDNMLNRQYPVLSRVRELGLLEKTAELGLLSKLEKNGLTLQKAEELLPLLEDAGILGIVANNQQLIINGVAPLAIEGAPFLLPLVAGALDIGPVAFYGAAAGVAGLDAYLFASGAELPFVGLSAGTFLGVILIPLSVVLAVVGAALGSLKN
mmetsp:Transcript_6953/g.15863  ORF Transcript_6953/g.15863 Transcript_6953/m.15863 type:complete len:224 (+) Transcript_6953:100-771(+)|eukprot:CAMPEP_0172327862 /NCGR_PEP_ID=MMETSP1058-20130122/60048_1 /TAXON_ID=83371 /ORGANISM="Detonula confervacea, Strain CCMP 353" /LENGTH=223 /DNA_ID=CAMNT_0013044947 /DNA_START=1358 /DNA_END=2029 /DNA_ORIENTATION=-